MGDGKRIMGENYKRIISKNESIIYSYNYVCHTVQHSLPCSIFYASNVNQCLLGNN